MQPGQPVHVRIPVKAGQVIGKVGNQTFDFALIDTTTTRKGFVKPEQFLKRDPWKPHTVDPFDYIDEPLRSELIAKDARKVPPFGGRIDYDIDGKLMGNWYRGRHRRLRGHEPPHGLLGRASRPSPITISTRKIVIVSIGNYDGRAAAVLGPGQHARPRDHRRGATAA